MTCQEIIFKRCCDPYWTFCIYFIFMYNAVCNATSYHFSINGDFYTDRYPKQIFIYIVIFLFILSQ